VSDNLVEERRQRTTAGVAAASPVPPTPARVIGRVLLGAATIVVSVNVWTGMPALALWIGSRAADGRVLSMTGIVVAIVALVGLFTLALWTLARLSRAYDRISERPPKPREPAPWMRSMRAERNRLGRRQHETNAVETIVIGSVVAAFVAFEIWFFVLAGSPIG
jgi:hypothetical protein